MKDPLRYFRVEAREILDGLSRGILELSDPRADLAEVEKRLLRLAHTLKGAARVVKQPEIADLAHALEDAIAARGPGSTEGLLAQVDAMAAKVAALDGPAAPPSVGPAPAPPSEAAPAPPPTRVDLDTLEELLDALHGARGHLVAIGRAGERIDAIRRRAEAAGLAVLAAEIGGAARELAGAVGSLDADLQRLDAHAFELRLVPASAVFAALARGAHDAARALGRRVVFDARGGDNHLDARVLGPLHGALLHLVRNAVAHGVEDPGEREAQGKPAAATITLEVARRGHRVTFTCRDDGRGIDEAAVRAAAGRRGISAGRALRDLVLSPGVSTAKEVTAFAGRGMGLDVVADVAARLAGEIAVESAPGRGAAFSITVPVSLSSLPVLSFEAGDLAAAVPLDAVRTALRLVPSLVVSLGDREALVQGAEVLPLLRVAPWADAGPHREGIEAGAAIVVEADGVAAALAVSRVEGVAHAILQPLPPIAGPVPAIGASLDAAGCPRPVLDPGALVAAAGAAARPASAAATPRKRVLAIDDSLTTRMLEQSILATAGYDVDVAASGEEALGMARVRPYDLFIVDVEMPGMDGFEFVSQTRRDPALSAVPSIIVSSRASAEDRRRGADAGARAYVVKGEFVQQRFLELVRGLA